MTTRRLWELTFGLLLAVAVITPVFGQGGPFANIGVGLIYDLAGTQRISVTNGITLGASGSPFQQLIKFTAAITPGSQAANTCAEQAFTVTGVAVGDLPILVSYTATGNATGYGAARVSATNTLQQTVCNPTAGALTPAATTNVYWVFR